MRASLATLQSRVTETRCAVAHTPSFSRSAYFFVLPITTAHCNFTNSVGVLDRVALMHQHYRSSAGEQEIIIFGLHCRIFCMDMLGCAAATFAVGSRSTVGT
jgi:hypothetical protein